MITKTDERRCDRCDEELTPEEIEHEGYPNDYGVICCSCELEVCMTECKGCGENILNEEFGDYVAITPILAAAQREPFRVGVYLVKQRPWLYGSMFDCNTIERERLEFVRPFRKGETDKEQIGYQICKPCALKQESPDKVIHTNNQEAG